MDLKFEKYQGAGNDFIILDGFNTEMALSAQTVAAMCDRKFGIGADGLIILGPADFEKASYHMKYFNADGKEGSLCGNGARCAFHFALKHNHADDHTVFTAIDGEHHAKALEEGEVAVTLADIAVDSVRKVAADEYFLDTGSPHVVRYVTDMAEVDVAEVGRKIRWHESYQPGGTNANFVQIMSGQLRMRTFERGVENVTLACGTGAVAVAAIHAIHYDPTASKINLQADGGKLSVSFERSARSLYNVWLHGPATFVYSGTFQIT